MEFEVKNLIMLPFCAHWFLKKWIWLRILGEELFLDFARNSDMQGVSKEVVVSPFETNINVSTHDLYLQIRCDHISWALSSLFTY